LLIARNLKVEMQKLSFRNKRLLSKLSKSALMIWFNFNTEEINISLVKLMSETGNPKLNEQTPGMLLLLSQKCTKKVVILVRMYFNYLLSLQSLCRIKIARTNKYGTLETGKSNRFDVVTVDENGKPRAVIRDLEVKIYKVEWRWWWDASEDNLSNYNSSNSTTSYKTIYINRLMVRVVFSFQSMKRLREEYLVRVADENGGHATAKLFLIDWPIWWEKLNTDASSASMLVSEQIRKIMP
jgi:hypothetical protein